MPDVTPELDIPYPLPGDAVIDYPTTGRELAELLEGLLLGSVRRLWDSVEAGIAYPNYGFGTDPLPTDVAALLVVGTMRSEYPDPTNDYLLCTWNGVNVQYFTQRLCAFGASPYAAFDSTLDGALLWGIACGPNANLYGYGSAGFAVLLPGAPGMQNQCVAVGGGAAANTQDMAGIITAYSANYSMANPYATIGFHSLRWNQFTGGRITVYGLGAVPGASARPAPSQPEPTEPPADYENVLA